MKTIHALAAIILLLATAACGGEETPSTSEPGVKVTEQANQQEIRITGSGPSVSPPFKIEVKGQYTVRWKSARTANDANDPQGCPIAAEMESASAGVGFHRNLTQGGQESRKVPGTMESSPFDLEAQEFYITVETDCVWEITFARQL